MEERYEPPYCDLAPQILAAAQATAVIMGHTFPAEGIAEVCGWFFERKRKKVEFYAKGQCEAYIWAADSPAAFLLACCKEDDATIGRFLDSKARLAKKARLKLHDEIGNCLDMLRKTPDSMSAVQWRDTLAQQEPELYAKVWAEDDREHGGDGAGSSWEPKPKPATNSAALFETNRNSRRGIHVIRRREKPPSQAYPHAAAPPSPALSQNPAATALQSTTV
jgi:hypothetical protein